MRPTIQLGDWGSAIDVLFVENGTPLPIGGADEVLLKLKRPGRDTVEKAASIVDGDAGHARYVIEEGLIDGAGEWMVQGFVSIPGVGAWHTERGTFLVDSNL
ncbi:MAG: hypothetical protein GY728_03930 [Phycisphaeraceae bacterium]|nr:hypothetical protein [Phycisphaeraceae bacterium]